MRPPSPRLPLEPLVRMYGSIGNLAAAVGRERTAVGKWSERGLTPLWADRVAVALGMHPTEVWPEWYAVTEEHAEAA
jgi:hypothetical protein